MLQEIMQMSGAEVFSKSRDEEGFTVYGNKGQIATAKNLILEKVVSCKKFCTAFLSQFTVWNNLVITNLSFVMPCFAMLCFVKVTVYLQREIFWIFIFSDKNKLPSRFLQTKKEFSKKSEYLPRNWEVSDFHRKLNFTLIDSILLPV